MSLFDQNTIVDEIRADRLSRLSGLLDPAAMTDDYIWMSVLAAESYIAKQLRVFLEPTYLLPSPVSQTDIASVPGGVPWAEDPGYDYDPDLFQGEGWGFLKLRHHPIIGVDYMQFAYPLPLNTFWNLPIEWLRLDKKYGHLRVVPAGSSYSGPFNAWLMQAMGGGRVIPQMIRIRYQAGLSNALQTYPELADLIKKQAMVLMLEDLFPGSSSTISADGLSQSESLDMNVFRDMIAKRIDILADEIHGIRCMVC